MNEFKNMNEIPYSKASVRVAHAGTVEKSNGGGWIFSDTADRDWHLMRIYCKGLQNVVVGVEITYRASQTCTTDFYINSTGGVDVAIVSASGKIKDRGISRALDSESNADGSVTVRAFYESHDAFMTFGTHCTRSVYAGTGTPQFEFTNLKLYASPGSWLDCIEPLEKITLVDVGAAGGIQSKWVDFRDTLRCVLFEPDETEATRLSNSLAKDSQIQVIAEALSNIDGERLLYVTRFPQCSSLLRPRADALANYKVGACFEVTHTQKIRVRRYDSLFREGRVPSPDVIKIDVQGAELQVLEGFGTLIGRCLGIELESHFYEVYEEQALLGDIISYLQTHGLYLRKLEPQMSFDRDLVEVNAFFTKRRNEITTGAEDKKLQIIEHVWRLKHESPVGALLSNKYSKSTQ